MRGRAGKMRRKGQKKNHIDFILFFFFVLKKFTTT